MVTGHVFIATSLDGFIAREDGDIDWLLEHDQAGEDHGYNDFIRDIDVIVMGRGTYEAVRSMGEADVRGRSTRLCGWRARHSIFPRTLHDQ